MDDEYGRWADDGGRVPPERTTMNRLPLDEAIEDLVEEYRMWLEEDSENVTSEWLRVHDQYAEVADGDEKELVLEDD